MVSAGSGVGVAAVQIAKLFGARVIATASSPDKLAKVRALGRGRDHLAAARSGTPRPQLGGRVQTPDRRRGVDVVIEHTGGETFKAAVKAAAKGGRIVTCGATGDYEPTLNLRYVFWRQLSILGSTMAPKGRLHGILELVAAGRLRGVVDRVLAAGSRGRCAPRARGAAGRGQDRSDPKLTRPA